MSLQDGEQEKKKLHLFKVKMWDHRTEEEEENDGGGGFWDITSSLAWLYPS